MKITLHRWWLAWLVSLSTVLAADMLPLCPITPQYFPQKLPMHCRMPRSVDEASPDQPQFPTLPPLPESYFRSLPSDKQPPPIPIPIPPFPGLPGPMPMPGPMGGLMPGPMGGPMPGPMGGPMGGPMPGPMGGPMGGPMPGMPGGMPMPMPMPVPMVGGPPHKLPVIVMPFYSQDHSTKNPRTAKPHKHREKKKPRKKKKNYDSTETESSSCEESSETDHSDSKSSSEHGFWKGRRNARKKMARRSNRPHTHRMKRKELKNKRNDLLTPILQYVTKDGYVIFEKKISKGEAKDWLKEFKPQSEMTEIKEVVHEIKSETKPEEKRPEELKFNPKSAEDFFKIDEEEKRVKALEINKINKEAAPIEVTTRKGKRKHRHLKLNPLISNKE